MKHDFAFVHTNSEEKPCQCAKKPRLVIVLAILVLHKPPVDSLGLYARTHYFMLTGSDGQILTRIIAPRQADAVRMTIS